MTDAPLDPSLGAFLAAFQAIAEAAHGSKHEPQADVEPLLPPLRAHLGADPRGLPVLTEVVPGMRTVDADVALAVVVGAHGGGRLLGVGGGEQRMHMSLSEIVQQAGQWAHQLPLGAVDYQRVATGPDTERRIVAFGLHLFHVGDEPVVVLQRRANNRHADQGTLEVLCADDDVASGLLAEIRDAMGTHSVLRGQVVTFTASPYGPSASGVTFLPRDVVPRSDVVLPDGTLDRIERQVLTVARHRDALRAAGQHLKRGVLLYGPPGTGKTHTVRHLVGASPGTTVILLAGSTLALVSVAADTARALQPAIVVLEDCDLVAEDRSFGHGMQPLLFEVLDALDGLATDADVTFLLTTNRADMLERALAQRPGRVDLAVEIPLPDDVARRRLFALYAGDLPFTPGGLDAAAAASAGVTASFVKEALRRAVLIAVEAGREPTDDDLAAAVDEMLSDAEQVTRSLLGVGGEP
jgi:hypothetical protein